MIYGTIPTHIAIAPNSGPALWWADINKAGMYHVKQMERVIALQISEPNLNRNTHKQFKRRKSA